MRACSSTSKESQQLLASTSTRNNTKPKPTLDHVFTSNFHNKYTFSNFLTFDVRNETECFTVNGKTIHKMSNKLKAIQRFLNTCIYEYALVNNDVVFSYRKGKSTLDAVKQHASNKYFFQTDISDFFNSIEKDHIKKVLNENLNNVPICNVDIYKDRLFELSTINGKLPIGFATSPLISNSCLFLFDNALHDYCKVNEITYTRYSDDIILSTSSNLSLLNIENVINDLLNQTFQTSFLLNLAKTKRTHKGNKLKLLGVVILPTGRLTVDIKVKHKLEALLHFYINDKDKFISLSGGDYDVGLSKVSGQLNYINMIDKEYLNKLRKKYGNSLVDMFFHKSVK